MDFGVIQFPGSNCDFDCFNIIKDVLGQPVRMLWHKNKPIDDLDCIVVPGGFSYGDYLRSGAIARFAPIMEQVAKYAQAEKGLVIGICNGFQILTESGLLPGALQRNTSLKFICKDVYLRVENNQTPFTAKYKKGEVINIPIAHMDGNYYADRETVTKLNKRKQVIFRYCDAKGRTSDQANPNGSLENIAGICNETFNVIGMMPHPERVAEKALGNDDGRRFFESILAAKAKKR